MVRNFYSCILHRVGALRALQLPAAENVSIAQPPHNEMRGRQQRILVVAIFNDRLGIGKWKMLNLVYFGKQHFKNSIRKLCTKIKSVPWAYDHSLLLFVKNLGIPYRTFIYVLKQLKNLQFLSIQSRILETLILKMKRLIYFKNYSFWKPTRL